MRHKKATEKHPGYIQTIDAPSPVNFGNTEYIYDTAGNVTSVIREGKANYKLSYDKDRLLKSKTIKMPDGPGGMEIVEK
ncbi:MAG: hypothetical protein ABIN01_05215 [Ferruginibacter sp.]